MENKVEEVLKQSDPQLMKDAYQPRDLQYKKIKQIYKSELQGPTLKEMQSLKNAQLLNEKYKKMI